METITLNPKPQWVALVQASLSDYKRTGGKGAVYLGRIRVYGRVDGLFDR